MNYFCEGQVGSWPGLLPSLGEGLSAFESQSPDKNMRVVIAQR